MKTCEKCDAVMDDIERICGQCGWQPLKPVERLDGIVPLDDELWQQLETAYGNSVEVVQWLRKLEAAEPDELAGIWSSIDGWGALDHQNSVFNGSFAAIPHLVRIAAKQPAELPTRHDILALVGCIAADGRVSIADAEKRDWCAGFMPSCIEALGLAIPLIGESLLTRPDESTVQWLLAAAAAICGYDRVSHELQYLFDPVECPNCGESVPRGSDA